MKRLLNTLYVTKEGSYLSLDGENVVVLVDDSVAGRLPLHTLESIVVFGYLGASPALMGKCAQMNIPISFLKPSGKFLARTIGKNYGNILLRREQYRICDREEQSLHIAKNIISAKLHNSGTVVKRALRDHEMRVDTEAFTKVSDCLKSGSVKAFNAENASSLMALEGESAARYFSIFDQMILQQKEDFRFDSRNRRPPADNVNALLSFTYSLMTSMCVSALGSVGLDPYAGFFHTERPGRCSLALDLVEEFRSAFADRFVLTMINRKMVSYKSFEEKEDGAIILTDNARRDFLTAWQQKKQEDITHPYLNEKIQWGLLPHVQSMLLARYIRGDLDDYPPFIWS